MIGAACAYANDEPFLLMAGAGFDGRVIAALDHRLKSHVGKAAYAGPMLGALAHPVDTLTVKVDGCPHEASWAVIANARHYGGSFVMARRTGIRERGLQAILFKAKNRAVLLGQLMALAMGQLDARAASHGDVEMIPCARASIAAQHPVPTQIDGDAFGTTPLEIATGTPSCSDVRLPRWPAQLAILPFVNQITKPARTPNWRWERMARKLETSFQAMAEQGSRPAQTAVRVADVEGMRERTHRELRE